MIEERSTGIMSLRGWFLFLFFLALINTLLAVIQLRGFLSRNSSIASWQNLEEFKRIARQQMYQALAAIGILGAACILGLYGIVTRQLSLLLVIVLNGAIIVIARMTKGIEERARSLPVDNEELAGQYKAICETWVKKPLPDF